MAHRDVEIAVEARLRALSPVPTIVVANTVAEQPADGSEYLELQFPVADVRRWTVNQRKYREVGGFRIVLHVPTGTGTGRIRDLGEELAAIFCDETFDGVNCRTPGSPYVDDAVEGPMIWASIAFPYDFTFSR